MSLSSSTVRGKSSTNAWERENWPLAGGRARVGEEGERDCGNTLLTAPSTP